MQIGMYEIHAIKTGEFRLDGGAMFGVIPKTIWQKQFQADDKNRILLALNTLLIIGNGKVILIDTGIGTKFNEKYSNIYGIDNSRYDLLKSLSKFKIQPEDVTDVILTHLHFDHVGGATLYDSTPGRIKLQFTNALHYIQKAQLNWSRQGYVKDRASYLPENISPLLNSKKVKILNGSRKLFDGIKVLISNGHTPGQQMVLIFDDENYFLYAGDLFPTSAHISIPWVMAYDLAPMETIKEKKMILEKAIKDDWFIFFEHDPNISCGTIEKTEKGFQLGKVVAI
jgi:glyoxylase-like metal-dependent hydrolase (beta-lactamase superfamily II)